MLYKLSIGLFVLVMSFFAFNKSKTKTAQNTLSEQERSSITFKEGKYSIDSNVIRKDQNKRMLLIAMEKEKLSIKKTFEEVPDFIRDFLVKNSYSGKFDIVNPGEEWKSGIANFGHTIITKRCDPVTKDTTLTISGDGAILPNKQFVYFGIGKSIALFSYYAAGYQNPLLNSYNIAGNSWNPQQNVVMIRFKDKKIIDFWYGGFGYGTLSIKGDSLKITAKSEIIKTLTVKSKNTGGC